MRAARALFAALLMSSIAFSSPIAVAAGIGVNEGLTASQWETCSRVFDSWSPKMSPCTAADIQFAAERNGDSPAQVTRMIAQFNEESLSDANKTAVPPASVLHKQAMYSEIGGSDAFQGPGPSASVTTPTRKRTHRPPKPAPRAPAAPATPVATASGSSEPVAQQPGETNPNDSLVNNDVMNLTDPACGMRGITVTQLSRCLRTGDPSIPDPLGNYQMDIHMSTGVLHPVNDVLTVFESVMNVVWMILLYILKGGLTLVGWAFSLSPFTNGATLGSVQTKLEFVYRQLDSVWLDAVFVAIGAYGLYLAFIRRKQSEAIGHLGASVVAILFAMAIIHAPATFIGKPAGFANSFAQDAISSANLAAQNQTGTVPASRLAGLTGDLFETFATGPFCALDTNDVSWCMSRPTAIEMKVVHEAVVSDHAYHAQAKAIAADVASRLPQQEQLSAYKLVYQSLTSTSAAPTRAALFLRYPPASTPREALYALYTGEDLEGKNPMGEIIHNIIVNQRAVRGTPESLNVTLGASMGAALAVSILKHGIGLVGSILKAAYGGGGSSSEPKPLAPNKVAIQGSGGLVQRCLVLMLTVIAFIGVLLVLIWLAVHLVSQALLGFVLLLATPVMMLTPAFGISGRKAFGSWAKTLFGAIASKAFYAAFLGVFVLALTALQEASTAALGSSAHHAAAAVAHSGTEGARSVEHEGSPGGGWGVPWVMQCLLCWAVFFKRNKIVGFFAIDPATHQQSGSGSMTAMRVLGAAYAAHRLGGVVAGAAKRPINAYRANALERRMGRQEATRDVAFDELESQELGVAGRAHQHNRQRADLYQNALDRTGGQLEQLKQNPDYKKYVAWKQSADAQSRLKKSDPYKEHADPRTKADLHEMNRGAEIAGRVSKLEAGRSVLKERHDKARALVDHGERNLHAHGQLLSPPEISNRVEARRASLAESSSNPGAWRRAENLELASSYMTPERLHNLERRAPNDPAAKAELDSTRRQVTARMEASERLVQGVPTRNQFDRKGAASDPEAASQKLRDLGHKDSLNRRARVRHRELKHQRYTRKQLYRS